jgi:hypothetical protein
VFDNRDLNQEIETMTKWIFQHENGSQIETSNNDLRGLELKIECGYRWVNKQDGNGWRPLKIVADEIRGYY